jgi:hypothetical protein
MRPTVGFGGPTEAVVDGEIPVIVDPTTTALVLSVMSQCRHDVDRYWLVRHGGGGDGIVVR